MTRDDINRWEAEIDSWRQRYEALLKMLADNQYLAPPIKLADKQSYELGLLHGVAAEREACAKVADDKSMYFQTEAQKAERDDVSGILSTAWHIKVCAAAIRARGNT